MQTNRSEKSQNSAKSENRKRNSAANDLSDSRSLMHRLAVGVAVLGLAATLAGCATARTPVSTPPPGPPTTASPDADVARGGRKAVQTGYATFLARSFHGNRSASGEIFDAGKLVAAHRTLPFGSVVRVTNLENGRAVTVRIIDRGPYGRNYREGTIIDLSRAAARRVGMIRDGQVRVRVVVLSRASGTASDGKTQP